MRSVIQITRLYPRSQRPSIMSALLDISLLDHIWRWVFESRYIKKLYYKYTKRRYRSENKTFMHMRVKQEGIIIFLLVFDVWLFWKILQMLNLEQRLINYISLDDFIKKKTKPQKTPYFKSKKSRYFTNSKKKL